MATVLITLRIMPTSPDENLDIITDLVAKFIKGFGGHLHRTEQKPIAFGLKSIEVLFTSDEAKGSTEKLESEIAGVKGVSSVEVIDVRRTVG